MKNFCSKAPQIGVFLLVVVLCNTVEFTLVHGPVTSNQESADEMSSGIIPASEQFEELVSRGWPTQRKLEENQEQNVEKTRQSMIDLMNELGIVDIPHWNLEDRKELLEPDLFVKYTQFFEAKKAYEEANLILTEMRQKSENTRYANDLRWMTQGRNVE